MIQQPIRLALAIGWHYGCNRKTLRGIKRYAVASHHSILIEPLSPQFFKAIRRWQPDAIIADPERPSLVEDLLALDLPTISVLCTWHMPDHPGVGKDDHAVGRAGAAHLLEKGLRRFGYVGYPDICWSQWRAEGFAQAVHDAGGECRQFSCSSSAFPRLASEKADRRGDGLRTWLREEAKPIGILCANDPLGQELAQLCRELDLRVPEDVAIVGVDNDDVFCELADPTLSSVDVPWERMGYEAAAMLDRLLAGEAMPTAPRLLPPAGVRQRESSDLLAIADEGVVKALRFIREQAHRPISVDDIAREAAVSRRALELRFRAALDRTPQQELIRTRFDRARQLLVDTDLPIAAVAERAGFSSPYRFSTAFRRSLGTTPSAYRRRFRFRP